MLVFRLGQIVDFSVLCNYVYISGIQICCVLMMQITMSSCLRCYHFCCALFYCSEIKIVIEQSGKEVNRPINTFALTTRFSSVYF